jgi:PAS domain S-box-containing protein
MCGARIDDQRDPSGRFRLAGKAATAVTQFITACGRESLAPPSRQGWNILNPAPTRILVVDSNPAALNATAETLQSAGYDVLRAQSGSAALGLVDQAALVLLDMDPADLDRVDLLPRLRTLADAAHIPMLYVAASFNQAGDIPSHGEDGVDAYLTRPVAPWVLIRTVKTLLFAHRAEARRLGSEARLSTTLKTAGLAIGILDSNLRFEDINPAFSRLTGYSPDELRGSTAQALLDLSGASIGRMQGQATCDGKGNRRIPVSWHLATDSQSRAGVLVLTEVTDRERLDAERDNLLARERSARADAERGNRLKEEFLATLSHELRNPLNAILGWSTLLGRTPNLPAPVMRAVQAIERNSRVQAQMIADLLDYAGITFGKMRLVTAIIDPYPVVQAALDVVQAAAGAAEVTLLANFGTDELFVDADPARLQQVVWNLLSNAIKFSRKGGTVELAAVRNGDTFQLTVRDHGAGITSEFLPRIFDRFSQQDASSTRSHGGLGLGLAIVRQLVTQHGGSISAASDGPGHGACFTVSIPLSEQQGSPSLSDSQIIRASDLNGVVALVVEDDVDARDLTKRILTDAGASVIEAASAEAALACIKSSGANFLVSDIGMAGTDGYQLMRALRSAGYAPDALPAIALTAFARMQDRNDSIAAGFQEHLVKPIDAQMLIARIGSLRRRANANAAVDAVARTAASPDGHVEQR